MENKYFGDYHTHTKYSDGYGTVEQSVLQAIKIGLKAVAITDHGFGNPKMFSLREHSFAKQREEVLLAREKYPQIEILHGIEADIISVDGTIDMTLEQCSKVDVLIAGFHRFARPKSAKDFFAMYANFNTYLPHYYKKPTAKKLNQNTDAVIKMLNRYPIDILAHINSCLVTDSVEVAKACADNNVFLELNVKHLHLIAKDIDKILQTDVKFIASTDAHKPINVGDFAKIDMFLSKFDIAPSRVVNIANRPNFKNKSL